MRKLTPPLKKLGKKLKLKVAQVQLENPDAVVEVWAMDKHRLGLKPVLRRVWVLLTNTRSPELLIYQACSGFNILTND